MIIPRIVTALLFVFVNVNAMKPQYTLEASHLVTDLLVEDRTLYAATDSGTVDIFDIADRNRTGQIVIPGVKDFLGDIIAPKIYSVDKYADRILLVSQGESGYREVYLVHHGELRKVIDSKRQFLIKKGLFIDADRIVLGLLGSEIVLYDLRTDKVLYRRPIKARTSGGSAFSDMVLDEGKRTLATADESGEVNVFDVETFKHLKTLRGQNVDNVYKIDFKQGTVITAGQDRRCALYRPDGNSYYLKADFLIYAAALNPSAKLGVFAATMENALWVFDTRSRTVLARLRAHQATLTDFAFVSEHRFFSAADEKTIYFWDISPKEQP